MTDMGNDDDTSYVEADHDGDDGDGEHYEDDGDGDMMDGVWTSCWPTSGPATQLLASELRYHLSLEQSGNRIKHVENDKAVTIEMTIYLAGTKTV